MNGEEWWWRVSVGTAADSKSFDGSATIEIRDYGDETSGYENHADLMDSLELHDFYIYEM